MKYHVKKGDKVLVNSGNYKGEEATIKAVITKNDRVVLEFTSKKDRAIGKRAIEKRPTPSRLHRPRMRYLSR